MNNSERDWRLLTLITGMDKRNKVESIIEKNGPLAYFVLKAKGTSRRSWLRQLGIKETAKLQYDFLLSQPEEEKLMKDFAAGLKLGDPGHGITYSTQVLYHSRSGSEDTWSLEELNHFCEKHCLPEEKTMYKKICVIVDLGLGDEVIEAAREAGVKGGTILHGLGSATADHATIFGFHIVPEKELVIMLTPNETVEPAITAINNRFKLDGISNGILYVQDVLTTEGLVDDKLNR